MKKLFNLRPELPFFVLGLLYFEGGYNLLYWYPLFGKEGSRTPGKSSVSISRVITAESSPVFK